MSSAASDPNIQDLLEFRRYKVIGNGAADIPKGSGILGAFLGAMTEPRAWYVTISRDDAIIFEARKDVYVYGVGVYAPIDDEAHDFTMKYRWVIQSSPNGKDV